MYFLNLFLIFFSLSIYYSDDDANDLYLACCSDEVAKVSSLLEKGVDPNHSYFIRGWNGSSPLHVACYYNHHKIVTLLVTWGADIEAIDTSTGNTPLHKACQGGSLESVEILIQEQCITGE